jgi:hypothetical protein
MHLYREGLKLTCNGTLATHIQWLRYKDSDRPVG